MQDDHDIEAIKKQMLADLVKNPELLKDPPQVRALYQAPETPQDWREYQLTAQAIEDNELDLLLLGEKGYGYMDRWSQGSWPTDVYAVFVRGITPYAQDHPEVDIKGMFEQVIRELAQTEAGREAVSLCLRLAFGHQLRGVPNLGLDLERLRGATPYGLAKAAVEADTILPLLLLERPYRYFVDWPGDADTGDFGEIYKYGLCQYALNHPEQDIKSRVEAVLPKLCETEYGRARFAYLMRIESSTFPPGEPQLILHLDYVCSRETQALIKDEFSRRLHELAQKIKQQAEARRDSEDRPSDHG